MNSSPTAGPAGNYVADVSGRARPRLSTEPWPAHLRSLAPLKLSAPDMMKQLNVLFLERKIEGHFITLTMPSGSRAPRV